MVACTGLDEFGVVACSAGCAVFFFFVFFFFFAGARRDGTQSVEARHALVTRYSGHTMRGDALRCDGRASAGRFEAES